MSGSGRRGGAAVAAALTALVAGSMLLASCNRATVLGPSPNDPVRQENQELRDQVQRLSLQVRELEGALAQCRAAERAASGAATAGGVAGAGSGTVMAVPEGAVPRLASIQIDSASEFVAPSADPAVPATLRLWVSPRDGRGRFLQLVGTLHASVAVIRAGAEPMEVASAVFGPLQVRDAWRSGFMGTHYAFAFPLAIPADLRSTPLTVTIRFDDALTGRSFDDQRRLLPVRIDAAPASASDGNPAPPA